MTRYLLCDVFTRRPGTGNQLAVVFDDGSTLADETCDRLAREFGWSEITVVRPPADRRASAAVAIWTPLGELPFAGHPVIGTTVCLGFAGWLAVGSSAVLELKAGPTPVDITSLDGRSGTARMQQQRPEFGPPIADRAAVAAALGLDPGDLVPDLPVQVSSTGSRFLIVPLRHRSAIERLAPSPSALPGLLGAVGARRPYCFCLETVEPGSAAHARLRDVDREDPATGSAAGPLGAYLVHHRVVDAGALVIEQGDEMGRPGRLEVLVVEDGGEIVGVHVGGPAVIWGEGELSFGEE